MKISSLTAPPIDHSFRRNFERYAEKSVTDLASVSGASLSLYIAISIAVAISIHERTGKLWEASKFVLLWLHFVRHFARFILPRFVNSSQAPQFAERKFKYMTNMVQNFSGFCATHRKITSTFMILWLIFASKISHIYINASCSYPCGTVFRCFLL